MAASNVLQRDEKKIGRALHKQSEDTVENHASTAAAQSSGAPRGQGSLLASAGSTRQQARSRHVTPPPAPRRSTLPDVQATQPPAVQAGQPQALPIRCTRLRRLFAALVFVVLLLGLPALLAWAAPGFVNSAKDTVVKYGAESPAMQKIAVFANSAKVAAMERVAESPAMQRLAEVMSSAKHSLLEVMMKSHALQKAFELTTSAMQKLAELVISLREALYKLMTESPVLQRAIEMTGSAKESMLNFSTECLLRIWGQARPPAEVPSASQTAADAECSGPDCEADWQAAQPVRTPENPPQPQAAVDAECTGPECQAETQTAKPSRSTEKPPELQAAPDAGCRRRGLQCTGLQEDNEDSEESDL